MMIPHLICRDIFLPLVDLIFRPQVLYYLIVLICTPSPAQIGEEVWAPSVASCDKESSNRFIPKSGMVHPERSTSPNDAWKVQVSFETHGNILSMSLLHEFVHQRLNFMSTLKICEFLYSLRDRKNVFRSSSNKVLEIIMCYNS